MALEEAAESRLQGMVAHIGKDLDGQNHAGEEIAHGQRLAALPIASAEGSLEVHGPDIVGLLWDAQVRAQDHRAGTRPVDAAALQCAVFEPAGDTSFAGNGERSDLPRQKDAQLLGPPSGMGMTQGNDTFKNRARGALWAKRRT
jgi:hypothetical protein